MSFSTFDVTTVNEHTLIFYQASLWQKFVARFKNAFDALAYKTVISHQSILGDIKGIMDVHHAAGEL